MNSNRPRSKYFYELSMAKNVGTAERVISGLLGALLWTGPAKHHRSLWRRVPYGIAGSYLLYRAVSGNCPVRAVWQHRTPHSESLNIRTAVYINQPVEEVYEYWRNLPNLQSAMHHIEKIDVIDNRHSDWTIRIARHLPPITLRTVILTDIPNRELSWRTQPGSAIYHAGKLRFHPVGNGATEVKVMFSYKPAAGAVGESLAHWLQPIFRTIVEKDIREVKAELEKEGIL